MKKFVVCGSPAAGIYSDKYKMADALGRHIGDQDKGYVKIILESSYDYITTHGFTLPSSDVHIAYLEEK